MENLSQALIIAGGMMLAILLISMVLLVRNRMSKPVQAFEDEKNRQQIVNFNKEYLSYKKDLLQGSEVLSVLTKAYDNVIALEPLLDTTTNLPDISKARKRGTNVLEPLVNVVVTFKENREFRMELTYEAVKFSPKGEYLGRPRSGEQLPKAHFNNSLREILGLGYVPDQEIRDFLNTQNPTLTAPQEIAKKYGTNTFEVFTINPNNTNIITITNEINEFINMGGSTPSIVKRNNNITPNNNWLKIKYTTPAASFIRKAFRWEGEEYNDEGYITEIRFEEI